MYLTAFINDKSVKIITDNPDKDSVVKMLAEMAIQNPALSGLSQNEIHRNFREREELSSTGIGHGIAIPHFRTNKVTQFVVGLISAPGGIEYDAIDNQPVQLLIFIIAPKEARNEHIQLLSHVSKALSYPKKREELFAITDEKELANRFRKVFQDEGGTAKPLKFNQFSVVIQDEEVVEEILEIFADVPGANITVLEAENLSRYLYAMPLFASFWTENTKQFNRLLLAWVDHRRSNELLRKLNLIIDKLKNKTGVLVIMQDIAYLSGKIEL
ncbi:MAG: PTS sugar transporter subunit IIA [Candidatus Cloacimonetes bacterium]|nr:PTS sugar transporter subunit IIA [Candidatus Cloacimonadota bacterium]